MTYKERIIATAYTGLMFVDGSQLGDVYKYEEEKLGHGVIDIMHGNKKFREKLKDAIYNDFVAMITGSLEIDEEEIKKKFEEFEKSGDFKSSETPYFYFMAGFLASKKD